MEEYVWVVPKKTDFSRVWILIITFKLLNAKLSYFEVSVVYVKLLIIKFCPPPPQVENNPRTGNFGALVRIFLGRTKELKISTECQEWVWEPQRGSTDCQWWIQCRPLIVWEREREERWSSCTFPWEKLQRYNYQHTYVAIISAHSQSSISTETDSAQVTKCFGWELFLLCWAALEVGVIAPLLFFSHFIAGLSHKSTFSWCDIIGVCK